MIPNIPKQSQIMEAFNQCVEDLIKEIRRISEENKHDDLMTANKTHKAIKKWFRDGGKIKKWS